MEWGEALFSQIAAFAQSNTDVGFTEGSGGIWPNVRAVLAKWQAEYEPLLWVISGALALVPGTFALHKWWHYRNSRLPFRLKELLEKEEHRLLEARSQLAKIIQKPGAEKAPRVPHLFMPRSLAKVLRKLRWSSWWRPLPMETADAELQVALADIEQQQKLNSLYTQMYRSQEATAYLLQGALAAARASKCADQKEIEEKNRLALSHFNRALAMEPNNPEIHEYIGHQNRLLGDLELALRSYVRVTELTAATNTDQELRSRAYRNTAEVYEATYDANGNTTRLSKARNCLDESAKHFPLEKRNYLDHAAIHEVSGRVMEKQKLSRLPGAEYSSALAIYEGILSREPKNEFAKAGRARMMKAVQDFYAMDDTTGPSPGA